MAVALDTLAYARRLREAGFSEQQAEGQAQALAAAMTDTLATKQDLRELETRIDARFVATKQDLSELDARFPQNLRELEIRVDARFARMDTRFDYLEKHLDTRLAEQEKRGEIRLSELSARFDGRLADLERRMTLRMLAGIGAVSALVKLL